MNARQQPALSLLDEVADGVLPLPGLGTLHKTAQHVLLLSDQPRQATGTGVWHGGSAIVHGWLNLKVDAHAEVDLPPAQSLQQYAHALGCTLPLAGMMTAASMNSLRVAQHHAGTDTVACIVTAGIQNARRAGDRADEQLRPGTINILLASNRPFTAAAAIEALLLATEAKTAACYDLGIVSPVSGLPATGTGTDSICLLSAVSSETMLADEHMEYCGKHTRLGEWIGATTYDAVSRSLQACLDVLGQSVGT